MGFAVLQSLYSGDRSLYKWGKRQPVRRRRGDVHGDLSAIVLHLDWSGSGERRLCSATAVRVLRLWMLQQSVPDAPGCSETCSQQICALLQMCLPSEA